MDNNNINCLTIRHVRIEDKVSLSILFSYSPGRITGLLTSVFINNLYGAVWVFSFLKYKINIIYQLCPARFGYREGVRHFWKFNPRGCREAYMCYKSANTLYCVVCSSFCPLGKRIMLSPFASTITIVPSGNFRSSLPLLN